MAFARLYISKFSRGRMPPDSPHDTRLGRESGKLTSAPPPKISWPVRLWKNGFYLTTSDSNLLYFQINWTNNLIIGDFCRYERRIDIIISPFFVDFDFDNLITHHPIKMSYNVFYNSIKLYK